MARRFIIIEEEAPRSEGGADEAIQGCLGCMVLLFLTWMAVSITCCGGACGPMTFLEMLLPSSEETEPAPAPGQAPAQTTATDTRATVRLATGCNLRPAPGTSNTPIEELAAGDVCRVNERKGSWLSVECDGTPGWVSKSCL